MKECPQAIVMAGTLAMTLSTTLAGPAAVKTESGKTWIEGIPVLTWEKSGQTTFCGALDAAGKVLGAKTDYTDLIGNSGLAFRLRWWRQTDGPGWCPSSPVGEFSPWDRMAAKSMGYDLDYHVHFDGKTDMSQYAGQVKQSIDNGVPVLGYSDQLDVSVIYGYADEGRTVYFRDYHKGEKDVSFPLKQTKGMIVFLKPAAETPSRKQAAIDGIKRGVTDWSLDAQPWKSGGFPGEYRMGKAAYAEWIDNIEKAASFTENQQKQLFRVGWWNFCVLTDARMHAAGYLRRAAPEFDGPTRASLEKAAGFYEQMMPLMGPVYREKAMFFGPWSGKGFTDWTDAVRTQEVEMLRKTLELETSAMAELEKAVETMK